MAQKTGRMKSGTEGWIRVTILDYSDIIARGPGGILTRGGVETYKVRFEQGKHKGEVKNVPAHYVEIVSEKGDYSDYKTKYERGLK